MVTDPQTPNWPDTLAISDKTSFNQVKSFILDSYQEMDFVWAFRAKTSVSFVSLIPKLTRNLLTGYLTFLLRTDHLGRPAIFSAKTLLPDFFQGPGFLLFCNRTNSGQRDWDLGDKEIRSTNQIVRIEIFHFQMHVRSNKELPSKFSWMERQLIDRRFPDDFHCGKPKTSTLLGSQLWFLLSLSCRI